MEFWGNASISYQRWFSRPVPIHSNQLINAKVHILASISMPIQPLKLSTLHVKAPLYFTNFIDVSEGRSTKLSLMLLITRGLPCACLQHTGGRIVKLLRFCHIAHQEPLAYNYTLLKTDIPNIFCHWKYSKDVLSRKQ